MPFAAFVSGMISIVFALILIWGIVSMAKEQRHFEADIGKKKAAAMERA